MKHFAASASASTVLAQHSNAREAQRPAAPSSSAATAPAGLRQYQVLQSRSEPAQRTLALKMR